MASEYDVERLNAKNYRKRVTKLAEEAIAAAFNDVEERVQEALIDTIQHVVPALLGLRRSWNEWELNRTNGIDREHPLGVELRRAAQDAAERIVADALKDYTIPKSAEQTIRKTYREYLTYAGEDAARNLAAQHAQEWAEGVIAEMMEEKKDA